VLFTFLPFSIACSDRKWRRRTIPQETLIRSAFARLNPCFLSTTGFESGAPKRVFTFGYKVSVRRFGLKLQRPAAILSALSVIDALCTAQILTIAHWPFASFHFRQYLTMMTSKPFSDACEENQEPILNIIGGYFRGLGSVLEIGSGTGQHAVYFSAALPHLTWQGSDRAENLPGIEMWRAEAGLANLRPALALDVMSDAWPDERFDAVFSANTAHIMAWPAVQAMFQGVAGVLASGGLFALYGPFNYGGEYSSASNARFDQWLKARDPHSGVKDVDDLTKLGRQVGLELFEDIEMPVNNRILMWRRVA
jgi:SAM-dependent methyltransferase